MCWRLHLGAKLVERLHGGGALDDGEPEDSGFESATELELKGRESSPFLSNVETQDDLKGEVELEAGVAEEAPAPTAQGAGSTT